MARHKSPLQRLRHPICLSSLIGLVAAIGVALLQIGGMLQSLELSVFDWMLLHRPAQTIDKRIVVIGETEADIRRYGHPLSDQVLADALSALENAQARVIGVDKYRDVSVAPGKEALDRLLTEHANIVWIFFSGNAPQDFIPAPAVLKANPERIGFNDIVEDADGVARRGLLFLDSGQNTYYAFPLLLAIHYLAAEQIYAQSDDQGYLNLNGVSLPPLAQNFGAYCGVDARGYQIMRDYPGLPGSFEFYTLSQLLDGEVPEEALRDKLVLIGGTAPSLLDYRLLPNEIRRYGVEQHAYFSSQLLNSALNGRPPLRTWPAWLEYSVLLVTALVGAFTGWKRGGLVKLLLLSSGELAALLGFGFILLQQGLWTPQVSPLLGWFAALALSVAYFSSQIRAERRQLMQLFASHVSPQVAAALWESREQFFSEGGVRPDMLTATVLFTDLSNFTTVAESMEPLVLMTWLNRYMDEMSAIVIEHGGMINKYIGDAIMAVFGVPVKRDSEQAIVADAVNAVQCAQQFNRRLCELNKQWQAEGLPTITMRAGIYTGPLVAGSLGGATRKEYTVIGDTVNTASRLESFDKSIAAPDLDNPCRILLGESTAELVKQACETELVGECQLKGKNNRLKIYRVVPTAD